MISSFSLFPLKRCIAYNGTLSLIMWVKIYVLLIMHLIASENFLSWLALHLPIVKLIFFKLFSRFNDVIPKRSIKFVLLSISV